MKYLILCQRDNVTASCFGMKHFLFEGPIILGDMSTKGTIPALLNGDVIKGKFYPQED